MQRCGLRLALRTEPRPINVCHCTLSYIFLCKLNQFKNVLSQSFPTFREFRLTIYVKELLLRNAWVHWRNKALHAVSNIFQTTLNYCNFSTSWWWNVTISSVSTTISNMCDGLQKPVSDRVRQVLLLAVTI